MSVTAPKLTSQAEEDEAVVQLGCNFSSDCPWPHGRLRGLTSCCSVGWVDEASRRVGSSASMGLVDKTDFLPG